MLLGWLLRYLHHPTVLLGSADAVKAEKELVVGPLGWVMGVCWAAVAGVFADPAAAAVAAQVAAVAAVVAHASLLLSAAVVLHCLHVCWSHARSGCCCVWGHQTTQQQQTALLLLQCRCCCMLHHLDQCSHHCQTHHSTTLLFVRRDHVVGHCLQHDVAEMG